MDRLSLVVVLHLWMRKRGAAEGDLRINAIHGKDAANSKFPNRFAQKSVDSGRKQQEREPGNCAKFEQRATAGRKRAILRLTSHVAK